MSFITRKIQFAIPALAATLFSTSVLTNPVPVVTINGAENGHMRLASPVRIQGVARDADGIAQIFGTIQKEKGRFIKQDGGLSKQPSRLKFSFGKTATTPWSTSSFDLPPGNYIFRIRAEDNEQGRSAVQEVNFTVGNVAAAAPATATQTSKPPGAAIRFPKEGAVLSKASSFSGIARDDQSVASVVATVMDTSNGKFLLPDGRFARSGQMKFKTIPGKNAQWSSPQMQLPDGNYLLSVKAIDNNGQEGQWTQRKFTVSSATAQAAQATTNTNTAAATTRGALAANGMSYCSGSGTDADGDGFGWQNNSSCVVAGSKADTHPNCASASSDPDGDGYGWENEKSCIVVTHCASGNSDPDGDGFGWENNRSCIVLQKTSRFAACASAASDPDGDGYGWENNKTCLVAK